MSYPFGIPRFSGSPYSGSAGFDFAPFVGTNRVILVAINGDLLPPIFHERTPLQRMRVVLRPPNQPGQREPSELLAEVSTRPLPPMPRALELSQQGRLRPRLVRGEIVRDQDGNIYEKIGPQIRLLHQLVSGPSGELLELVPASAPNPDARVPVASEPYADFDDEARDETEREDADRRELNPDSSEIRTVAEPQAAKPKRAFFRKLFPDPGLKRIVRLGDFKLMLTSQLAHPERLRNPHRLACYLQVYETIVAQRLENLAASALGDPARASQFQVLTELAARQVGLNPLWQPRRRPSGDFPCEPAMLLSQERVFRLQLAHDPTADEVRPSDSRQSPTPLRRNEPLASAGGQGPPSSPGVSPKQAIPARFLNPWEFKFAREEVLYDMNVTATFGGWLSSLLRRLKSRIGSRGQLRKWQLMLRGKSPEEQLWGMAPPKGGLTHPKIRGWVMKTLELAGYEPHSMLLEWEIFWRRKGV